jgi:hypothetical protein
MNGGSYNVLLNTTSKRVASIAASLAILSYIATGTLHVFEKYRNDDECGCGHH